jgi:uncharacterized protein YbjT (DUF2867 family)
MSTQTILVTGATGATGGYTIKTLLENGATVRALVRQHDERSERLRGMGVEVVLCDLLDFHAVKAALSGVYSAYFVYPIRLHLLNATAYFAEAARQTGVKALVNMSQISARPEAVSHAAQDHWFSEQIFQWSGVPTTHLRPTFFMEWLLYAFQRPQIAEHDLLKVPAGEGRHAPIAAEDQARLIAEILMRPAAHAGAVYPLYGDKEMNHYQIAAAVSQALGRTITYEPETMESFAQRLGNAALPEHFVQHICAVYEDYQHGIFAGTNDLIERYTGKPPMSVQTFVALHRSSFEPEQARP